MFAVLSYTHSVVTRALACKEHTSGFRNRQGHGCWPRQCGNYDVRTLQFTSSFADFTFSCSRLKGWNCGRAVNAGTLTLIAEFCRGPGRSAMQQTKWDRGAGVRKLAGASLASYLHWKLQMPHASLPRCSQLRCKQTRIQQFRHFLSVYLLSASTPARDMLADKT